MIETIGDKLVEILADTIAIAQDQDGQDRYPYAVYSLDVALAYVKGAVYKYSGMMYIYIYADTASEALTLRNAVEGIIAESMQDGQYRSRLTSATSNDDNGKYVQTLEYSIAQFNIE